MGKEKAIEKLEEEIRVKRDELNKIVCEEIDKNIILGCSQELDELINKYYHYSLGK